MGQSRMSEIFLNYRRDDEPGYVARLADGLTEAFGAVVFRDVDSIDGGSKWKVELQKQVSQSQILIAVFGRRWEALLAERDPETDHLRFELNLAHKLEIPVIPVQMQDVNISGGKDLGDLGWLKDLQFIELSDQQGRWAGDLDNLVECIARATSLERVKQPHGEQSEANSGKKVMWLGAVNVIVVGVLIAALLTEQIQRIDAQFVAAVLAVTDVITLVIWRWRK